MSHDLASSSIPRVSLLWVRLTQTDGGPMWKQRSLLIHLNRACGVVSPGCRHGELLLILTDQSHSSKHSWDVTLLGEPCIALQSVVQSFCCLLGLHSIDCLHGYLSPCNTLGQHVCPHSSSGWRHPASYPHLLIKLLAAWPRLIHSHLPLIY